MADNASVIWQFLASKGLSPAQIAGIIGNLQIESGLSPTAHNANEDAIGLAQWEGGRRTGLQRFASQRGTSETDLNTQLEFLWAELNGSESNAFAKLRAATTPGDAAAAFDQYYERSSGAARQQRINAANQFATNGGQGGFTLQSGGGGRAGGFGASVSFSAPSGGSSSVTTPVFDEDRFNQVLGSFAGLIQSVPELRDLMQQYIQAGQTGAAWSDNTLLTKFHQSEWFKSNGSTARQLLAMQISDPAQFAQTMQQEKERINNTAAAMGVNLPQDDSWQFTFAMQAKLGNWDDATLKKYLSQQYVSGVQNQLPSGDAATAFDNLEKLYQMYGVPYTYDSLHQKVADMIGGRTNISTYLEQAKLAAKSMYPSLAPQIEAGLTVKDIADPYVQTMAKLLEINPQSVNLSDPMIKRALQGSITTSNGSSTATTTPLWQFEQQVRDDPRWRYTDNANASAADLAMQIGRNWGFE